MSGKKGMGRSVDQQSARSKLWRSMRIMRHFTIPDLLRVVKETTYQNVRNFLGVLVTHNYVAKGQQYISGRTGEFQRYVLIRNIGPVYPCNCELCGKRLSSSICQPAGIQKSVNVLPTQLCENNTLLISNVC